MDLLSYIMGRNAGLAAGGGSGGEYTGNRCYIYDSTKEYETVSGGLGSLTKLSDDVVFAEDYASMMMVMDTTGMAAPDGVEYLGQLIELEETTAEGGWSIMNSIFFITELVPFVEQAGITSTGVWATSQITAFPQMYFCLIRK